MIYQKLAKIQSQLFVPKGQKNSFGNYNYRSCEDILKTVKPICEELGCVLFITNDISQVGDRVYVEAKVRLIDLETGEEISSTAHAREEETKKGMDGSQITGAASSYARKYALAGLFCIDNEKDSDATNTHGKDAKEVKEIKADEKKTAAVEQMIIAPVKAQALISKCEAEGVRVSEVCALYRVKGATELTEKMYRNINDNWEKVKEKCGN